MQRTIVVNGRRYRRVDLPAADTSAARRHISAERPIGYTTAKEIREEVAR